MEDLGGEYKGQSLEGGGLSLKKLKELGKGWEGGPEVVPPPPHTHTHTPAWIHKQWWVLVWSNTLQYPALLFYW